LRQNPLKFVQYLFIAKTDHPITVIFKPAGAGSILILLIIMNIPINFNDQVRRGTGKISDERPNDILPVKFQASQASVPQLSPESFFRRCGSAAHFFSRLHYSVMGSQAALHKIGLGILYQNHRLSHLRFRFRIGGRFFQQLTRVLRVYACKAG